MKVSRFFIKLIKLSICVIMVLGVLIPTVTLVYKKVVSGSRIVATEYFNLDYASIKLDHFYARSVSQDVSSCIAEYVKAHTLLSFNTKELYAQLKMRCKLIKDFDCRVHVPRSVDVCVVGVQPYCVINKNLVLGDKRRLFTRDCFAEYKLDELPQVTVDASLCGPKLHKQAFTFLHKIPKNCWQKFAITYHTPSYIELVATTAQCPSVIVVDERSFFDENKFREIGNVFSDMVKRGFLSSKTLAAHTPRLIFDLRFDRRVVVRCKDAFIKRGTGL